MKKATSYSVHLTYDEMNLIYKCLQDCELEDTQLKRIESLFRLAQMSYGVHGAFYDC